VQRCTAYSGHRRMPGRLRAPPRYPFWTRFNVSSAKSVQVPAGSFWRSRNVKLSVFGCLRAPATEDVDPVRYVSVAGLVDSEATRGPFCC